jgi:hypothetical protein
MRLNGTPPYQWALENQHILVRQTRSRDTVGVEAANQIALS